MKFPSSPLRSAIAAFAIMTVAAPFAGVAGTFTWILLGSSARISHCIERHQDREWCERENSWDSVSFSNLFKATWGGYVLASPVLGAVAGALALRSAKPKFDRVLAPELRSRIEDAVGQGLNLDEILKQAGYGK